MEVKSKITKDLKKLEELQANLKLKEYARVGILGTSKIAKNAIKAKTRKPTEDNSEPITNIELGILHEFGSYANNIPARSWLRSPLMNNAAKTKFAAFIKQPYMRKKIMEGNLAEVLKWMGVTAEILIQKAFATSNDGKWAPNSEVTIALKGSSKPLIDTGQLRKSVSSDVVKK